MIIDKDGQPVDVATIMQDHMSDTTPIRFGGEFERAKAITITGQQVLAALIAHLNATGVLGDDFILNYTTDGVTSGDPRALVVPPKPDPVFGYVYLRAGQRLRVGDQLHHMSGKTFLYVGIAAADTILVNPFSFKPTPPVIMPYEEFPDLTRRVVEL